MVSPTLEQDLLRYSKRRSGKNFDKVYVPLTHIFDWLVSKQYSTVSSADYHDIKQLVFLRVVRDIKYYKPDKGNTCLSFVRMIMTQELHKQKRLVDTNKFKTTQYDTNKDSRHDETTEERNMVSDYQLVLESYLVDAPLLQRKVLKTLIQLLPQWEKITTMPYQQRIAFIAKKSRSSKYLVVQTFADIKRKRIIDRYTNE